MQKINNNIISPILKQKVETTPAPQVQAQTQLQTPQTQAGYSPMLSQMILAQHQNYNTQGASEVQAVQEAQPTENIDYKNNLRTMFRNNEANILAVIPRTMNAKDTNGDDLITEGEVSGNFINAVERLDEIKEMGFNTLHILPVHPTGKVGAKGTAGSLYSPADFLEIDPNLRDPNDPRSAKEQFKYFIDECHKRDIKVLLDLPSCASLDLAQRRPELTAKEKNGEYKTPGGWADIKMLAPWEDETRSTLNKDVLQMHKDYVDMCVELGVDGIRSDVARAKPVEFWNVIIPYSRSKDPEFGWLAETYTYEDASPQINMPKDRPNDLLYAGFDSYYGQWHIFKDWLKADDLHKYVIENIEQNNNNDKPNSVIGSFATHDDKSPMFNGGAPYVMMTTGLQATLPQMCPYFVDGIQSGDYYLYKYANGIVPESQTQTDSRELYVHEGLLDIFNNSRKPGGNNPEIGEFIKSSMALKTGEHKEVINKGSYIPLKTSNDKIIAFARHLNGKTLLTIANRDVNAKTSGTVEIPGLSVNQKFENLLPKYGESSFVAPEKDGLKVELGTARVQVFEIDTPEIEKSGLKVYKQKM
ncbi:hypothetical protein IKA15_04900 [bacterium]|nr:hypothetical protein [bacterium]